MYHLYCKERKGLNWSLKLLFSGFWAFLIFLAFFMINSIRYEVYTNKNLNQPNIPGTKRNLDDFEKLFHKDNFTTVDIWASG